MRGAPGRGSSIDAAWARDFSKIVVNGLASTQTPGMSVAMVRGGHTVFSAGYGYADVEHARPVTPDTVFQIASVSKTVTATAMMMVWEEGAFRLDEPIAPHLEFPVRHPKFPDVPITFRHLFTHTSGISDALYDDLTFVDPVPPLDDFLQSYLSPGGKMYDAAKCYSDAKPGTEWSYSNIGVALLGYLAGRVNSEPLDVITRKRIFASLGMRNTSWRYEGVRDDRLALPYSFENAKYHPLPRTIYPDWPAGLLCTSANDFAKFLESYTGGERLLRPQTIATMFTPDPVPIHNDRPGPRQGLIWELSDVHGSPIALHLGGDPGAATIAAIDIGRSTAALAFANISAGKNMLAFQKDVIRRLLEKAGSL